MDFERHQLIGELFLNASRLQGEKRAAYLAEACADDAALRAEVDSLLAHDATQLTGRAGALIADGAAELVEALPERIGGYRILSKIGSGVTAGAKRLHNPEDDMKELVGQTHKTEEEKKKEKAQKKKDHGEIKKWVKAKRPKDTKAAQEVKLYDLIVEHGVSATKAKSYVKKAIDNDLKIKRLQFKVKRGGEPGLRGKMIEEIIESDMKLQMEEKKKAKEKGGDKKSDGDSSKKKSAGKKAKGD